MPSYSLGIDIGGTFTDIVVYDHDAGRPSSRKIPNRRYPIPRSRDADPAFQQVAPPHDGNNDPTGQHDGDGCHGSASDRSQV